MVRAVLLLSLLLLAATPAPRFAPDGRFPEVPILLADDLPAYAYQAAGRWNDHAGLPLFEITHDGQPQVRWQREPAGTQGGWADIAPALDQPYTTCTVHTDGHRSGAVWLHELGHCLGLADSLPAEDYDDTAARVADMHGTTVCDDPGHPAWSDYVGALSYCQGWPRVLTRDDLCGLHRLGYLTARQYLSRSGSWAEATDCAVEG